MGSGAPKDGQHWAEHGKAVPVLATNSLEKGEALDPTSVDGKKIVAREFVENLEWSAEFETGIAMIDDQHQVLFRLLNDFIEANTAAGEERERRLLDVFERLGGYVYTHF